MIFDTHAHYDDPAFNSDRDELLAALPPAGIGGVVLPGVTCASSQAVINLAKAWDFLYPAAGIHPHEARAEEKNLPLLEQLLSNAAHGIVALGECGLDYHYDHSPRETQKAVFDAQLSLARRYRLPVIIHEREAFADCVDILQAHPGLCAVFHCFSEDAEAAQMLASQGFYLSFTGVVTYKKAHAVRQAAAAVPSDRLLIETDAPYMSPEPVRGRRSDSRMLPHILAVLSSVRGEAPEALEENTWRNARHFFGLPD